MNNVSRREIEPEPIYISDDEIIIIESDTDDDTDDEDDWTEEQLRMAEIHEPQVIANGPRRWDQDSTDDEEMD